MKKESKPKAKRKPAKPAREADSRRANRAGELSQRRVKDKLNLNEEGVRQLIDLDPHFIFAKDAEGRYILANKAMAEEYHITVEELLGKTDADLSVAPEIAARFRAEDLDVIRSGKPLHIPEELVYNHDGTPRILTTTKIPFIFSDTNEPAVLGIAVNITDLKRIEKELRESEGRLLTVLESSPIPMMLNSLDDGIVLYANSASEELFGRSLSDLVGSKAAEYYVNPKDRFPVVNEIAQHGSLRDHEVLLKRSSGAAFWASLSSEKTVLEGRDCILSCIYDISGRKRAETLQSAVYQISDAANKSSSLDELYRLVHATIGQVMPARNFFIALYDEENDLLSFPYYVDEMDDNPSLTPSKPGRGMTEYLLRTGKPVLNTQADFEELARLGEVELVGSPSPIWIGAPLTIEDRTIGVIALQDYHDANVYTERELRMLEYVSEQVAKAIERTRLHEETQRKNRILMALQEATLSIVRQTELSEVLQAILTQAQGLFDANSSYIYLVSPDETELTFVLAIGHGQHLTGTRVKPGEGLAGKVWQTGKAIHVTDYQSWLGRSDKFTSVIFHSIAGVPLFSGDKVIGVLGVTYREAGRHFSQEDIELLTRFAQLASIAYENARLYTLNLQELAERKQAEALQAAIYRISDATSSNIGMDEFYGAIHEALKGVMVAENFYIALYDRETSLLSFPYHVDEKDDTPLPAPLGKGSTSYVIRNNRALLGKSETMKELEERGILIPNGTRSIDWLGVPLKIRNETIGAMAVQAYDEHVRYTQRDLDILSYVSNQVASSIERKQAEISLKSSEEQYRELYQNNPLMLFTLSLDGAIIAMNQSAIAQLEYPEGELIGKPVLAVIHAEDQAVVWKTLREFALRPAQDAPWEFRKVTRSGKVIWVSETSRMISVTGGGQAILVVCDDITKRKQAEADLQTSESRYRLSARATNDVIWEWDILSNEKTWSENLQILFGHNLQELKKDSLWWENHIHPQDSQRVLEKMNNALLNEETIWEDEYRFMRSDGSASHVIDRGYIERDPSGKPIRMIGAISDITDRRRREDELAALASFSAALRVAGSRDEILQVVLDQILLQFEARGVALTLLRTGADILVVEAAGGEWSACLGSKDPPSGEISRRVMKSGKPCVIDDLEQEALENLNGTPIRSGSFISVPLSTPTGVIGALNLGRATPFRSEDVRLVMNIADMAANAIQRASAYEQMRQQIDRVNVLRTIDMFIASGADLHLTLQTIVNQTITHLGCDAACILMLNQGVHALEFAEGAGFRTAGVRQTSLRLGDGFAGQAVLKREMVRVDDLASLKDHPLHVLEGFACYYGVPLIAKGDVKGVMEIFHRAPLDPDRGWLHFLESLAAQAALAIDNASLFSSLQRSNMELGIAYETTLEGWSAALDMRDRETEGHTQRVTNITLTLAEAMGVSEKDRVQIRRGALLHDIGKMGIPDRILLKPDTLTGDEWEIMRQHPVYAYRLLHPIPHLRPALDIPYCHHERWDGSGYPRGLKEESIPLAARVFAVADVWDALCSDRPYRPAWERDKALSYIKSLSGVHFDPKVVEVFLRLVGAGK